MCRTSPVTVCVLDEIPVDGHGDRRERAARCGLIGEPGTHLPIDLYPFRSVPELRGGHVPRPAQGEGSERRHGADIEVAARIVRTSRSSARSSRSAPAATADALAPAHTSLSVDAMTRCSPIDWPTVTPSWLSAMLCSATCAP